MNFEAAKYEKVNSKEDNMERLTLIKLIMEPYVAVNSEEKCGEKFNLLYEKSIPELRIYYQVFK